MEVELDAEALGQRVDVALLSALKNLGIECTRSQLSRAFKAKAVLSDGRPLKPGVKVDAPLVLEVELPAPEPLVNAFAEELPLAVLHEDEDLLVVNKAAGMVVHAGPGHSRGTLVNAVLHHLGWEPGRLPVLPGNPDTRPGIVHRLDRDTSGVMVISKTTRSQDKLALQFREHSIEREYLALVRGVPGWAKRRIETLHGRDPRDRRRFSAAVERGRRAVSTFELEETLEGASLLRCRLETGRTHQIRMHAAHLGCPIIADALYANTPKEPRLREVAERLGRQGLHAAVLGFEHPGGGRMRFEAQLPDDIATALNALRPG